MDKNLLENVPYDNIVRVEKFSDEVDLVSFSRLKN